MSKDEAYQVELRFGEIRCLIDALRLLAVSDRQYERTGTAQALLVKLANLYIKISDVKSER